MGKGLARHYANASKRSYTKTGNDYKKMWYDVVHNRGGKRFGRHLSHALKHGLMGGYNAWNMIPGSMRGHNDSVSRIARMQRNQQMEPY